MASQEEYVQKVYADALALGIPDAQARLAAAQSALETGYGKHAPGNAYFGIKAGSSWTGPTQNLKTHEEVNGRMVPQTDAFRAYSAPEESLGDWWNTVQRRWPDAANASTFDDAVAGLRAGQSGGYATDSRYGSKLGYVSSNYLPNSASRAIDNFAAPAKLTPSYLGSDIGFGPGRFNTLKGMAQPAPKGGSGLSGLLGTALAYAGNAGGMIGNARNQVAGVGQRVGNAVMPMITKPGPGTGKLLAAMLQAPSTSNAEWANRVGGTQQNPITYDRGLATPGDPSRPQVNGIDMAFMPQSVQRSSRWNTGY